MKKITDSIKDAIFQDGAAAFAVLDGASVPELLGRLDQWQPNFECLYRGQLAPDLAAAAPYLIQLEPEGEFTEWLLSKGWGGHWGVLAASEADLQTLRQHFRRFLTVYDESGKPLLFRYYDPRVLRIYLPSCAPEEVTAFFGPVKSYVMEGEQPDEILRFERDPAGALKVHPDKS